MSFIYLLDYLVLYLFISLSSKFSKTIQSINQSIVFSSIYSVHHLFTSLPICYIYVIFSEDTMTSRLVQTTTTTAWAPTNSVVTPTVSASTALKFAAAETRPWSCPVTSWHPLHKTSYTQTYVSWRHPWLTGLRSKNARVALLRCTIACRSGEEERILGGSVRDVGYLRPYHIVRPRRGYHSRRGPPLRASTSVP